MFGAKTVVGLDIGSQKVKAVQLRKAGGRLELERFGIADVYPNGDKSAATGDIRDLKAAAVRRALETGNITARYAVSAVSGESIIVRYIQLPDMPEAEMKNALRWEAEEYIPFHIDEVNLDSVILGPSASPGKIDVLLVSAKKDLVNEHVEIIRGLGLTPLIIDVQAFAFLNCYEANYTPPPTECVALVNIGADITSINIYIGNTSRFSRDIGVAGNAITQTISSKAGLPFAKAEEMKRTLGAPVPEREESGAEPESALISSIRGTVERITGGDLGDSSAEAASSKAIRQVLTNLVGEVRRSIQFFENQAGGATVSKVMLGGGSARMPNIIQYLASELDLAVELMDPLKGITPSRDVNKALLDTSREHLAVGIGLALRKVLD